MKAGGKPNFDFLVKWLDKCCFINVEYKLFKSTVLWFVNCNTVQLFGLDIDHEMAEPSMVMNEKEFLKSDVVNMEDETKSMTASDVKNTSNKTRHEESMDCESQPTDVIKCVPSINGPEAPGEQTDIEQGNLPPMRRSLRKMSMEITTKEITPARSSRKRSAEQVQGNLEMVL